MGMSISEVTVNHTERNYFNDYDEIRRDDMVCITAEKVAKAIDKLVRRYRSKKECDVLFVTNSDGTGWRLMYDIDPELFERGIEKKGLRLRHYTNMRYNGWDTDECVSVTYAKEAINGEER
jgi:hypothetical protein